MPSRVPLAFGGASFGKEGQEATRFTTIAAAQEVVDVFVGKGYKIIDSARVYGNGTSDEYIGKLDLKGARVDTKAGPWYPGGFTPAALRAQVLDSVKALAPHKIRVLYLHFPDRKVPYEDILREIDALHKEGLFDEFGLSNHYSWEVAEFATLAKANGWIKPTVYQAAYNAIERTIEAELIPALRKYGLRMYAYSPLAGGLLVGKLLEEEDILNSRGSRWDPTVAPRLSAAFRAKYIPMLPIIRPLKDVLNKHQISLAQAAQRWLQHHSALTPDDAVVIGASTIKQLEQNIGDAELGPLPDEVVKVLDEAWEKARGIGKYYAAK